MGVFILCFLASVMFFAAGLYFYENQEKTAFHKTMDLISKTNKEVEDLKNLLGSNISTIATANIRIKAMEEEVKKVREELDIFRDQVADTREKQIKLRDALSRRKSQVTLPTGPIPIEISMGPTIPPKAKKQMKEIKKQLDGLSR